MGDNAHNKHEKADGEIESWYKDFVDHARDLVQCVDSEGRFIYVNQAWLSTLKYAAEEVVGLTLWEIIHPDSMEHCRAVFKQVLTGKASGEVEAIFVAKDSTPVFVEGNVNVKLDKYSQFVHTRGIFRDVTARKKMETALLETETERKSLLDAIPDLMFLFNKNGHFIDYKAENHNQLILKPEGFMEKHVTEVLPPDLAKLTLDRLAQLFESGKFQLYEYPLEIAGKQKIFESRLVPCGDDRALAIVRDISERKTAEEALRHSEENLRTTLNSIGDAVITTDVEGLVNGMNPVAEHLTGWSEDEARGRSLAEVFKIYRADTMEPAFNPVSKVMQTGEVIGLANHTLLVSKKGDRYHITDSAAPIRDTGGQISGVVLVFRDITEEYLVREKLKESEVRYRTLVDNVPIGIYRNTPGLEGRFLAANPAFLKIFGIAGEEELQELKVSDLYINPLDRKAFSDQLLKENELAGVELKLKKLDGTPIWASVTAQVVRDENNKAKYFDCALENITERKQAEELLNMQNAMLKTQLEVSPDGIFIVDENERIISYNRKFCDIWGIPEEIMASKHRQKALDYVLPKLSNPDEFTRRIFELYDNRQEKSYEEISLKDGRVLERYSASMFDDEGQYYGRVWYYSDITERKQAEEALRENERRMQVLMDNLPGMAYRCKNDKYWTMEFVSEGSITLCGYKPEELIDNRLLSYSELILPRDRQRIWEAFQEKLQLGDKLTLEYEIVCKDGTVKWVWEQGQGIYSRDGELEAIEGFIADITERKKYEARLKHMSYHDQLTGLYNRHYLEEEMKRLDTERQLPISIIMADLNGLKLVNDTYGHQAGDEMLKKAAEILRNTCREDDLIARFGGDEFVLYLPRTPEKETRKISERIEKVCRKALVSDIPLSLSTGLAVKISADKKFPDLLREAEDSMYRNKLTESRSGKSAIVYSLLKTLAAKSFETETHTRNMQEAAQNIGEKLGLPHSELHRLQLLITLHDIGKINIPEELLTKNGSLTAAEWDIMKKHSETGYRVAKATEEFAHVAEDILAHHERWDGSGYPQGLKGEAIPILARITAIADAFEVMSNGRPYKKAMSRGKIVAEFRKCAGNHFDPHLAGIFLELLGDQNRREGNGR